MAGRSAKYDTGLKDKRSDHGIKRGPYKTKKAEPRGYVGRERKYVSSFWKNHTMDQIIQLDGEELDKVIDLFLDNYIKNRLTHDRYWNFPDKA